jgi:hypothetical protein
MDADFIRRDKPRYPEPARKSERDDRHLVKPLGMSEDSALFQELVRIVNEAQGRDAEDEHRLYIPMPIPRRSLSKGGSLDPGARS